MWASFYWVHDQVEILGQGLLFVLKCVFSWLLCHGYALRPFLHLVHMVKISRGVVSL
jgi:hypothetical protein